MKSIKVLIVITLLLASNLYADEARKPTYLTLGGFNESGGDHSGAEISVMFNVNNNIDARVSGVLYTGINDSKVDDLFAGYSLTGYLHLGSKHINPYLGVGIFFGKTFHCSDTEEEVGLCEDETVLALYPEFGVAFNIGKFHVFPYVRRYFDTNSNTSTVNAYGIQLGFNSD